MCRSIFIARIAKSNEMRPTVGRIFYKALSEKFHPTFGDSCVYRVDSALFRC